MVEHRVAIKDEAPVEAPPREHVRQPDAIVGPHLVVRDLPEWGPNRDRLVGLADLTGAAPGAEDVRRWYEVFKELHGTRPTAAEAMHEGFNPRAVRKHYGSWLGFVEAMGDLSDTEIQMRRELSALLEGLDWSRVHARRVARPTATQ